KLAYETWVEGMISAGAADKIQPQIAEVEDGKVPSEMKRGDARVYYLIRKDEQPGKADFLLSGTGAELVDPKRLADRTNPSHRLLVPTWNKNGKPTYFDADHIHDEQLGGADTFSNMWLWQLEANRDAGPDVAGAITSQASDLIKAAEKAGFWKKAGVKA